MPFVLSEWYRKSKEPIYMCMLEKKVIYIVYYLCASKDFEKLGSHKEKSEVKRNRILMPIFCPHTYSRELKSTYTIVHFYARSMLLSKDQF